MKNKLKTFPEHSLGENLSKTSKVQASEALKEIVSEIQEIKFEIEEKDKTENVGLKLLGELLGFLRQTKEMSTLMVCRQIKNIECKNNVAIIDSDDSWVAELETNDRHSAVLRKFFESRGLGFKIKEKQTEENDVDKLNRLLGGKLVIK